MSDYPEHEKLKAVQEESQAIGAFLDSLAEYGYVLCEQTHFEGFRDPSFVPTGRPIPEILARYFKIDLTKIEAEKRQMLERLREAS